MVNKVSIRLPASGYENARKLQQNAQNWSSRYLPGLLENTFDELNLGSEFLFIEKIEIDIEKYPWQLSDAEWQQLLVSQFSSKGFNRLPPEIILKEWIFFLTHGGFERNAVLGKIQEIENYLLDEFQRFSAAEINRLEKVFSSKRAIKRLFYIHSEDFAGLIFEKYFKLKFEKARQLYRLTKRLLSSNEKAAIKRIQKLNFLAIQNQDKLKEKLLNLMLENPENSNFEEKSVFENRKIPDAEKLDKKPDSEILLHCENAGLVLLLPFIKPFFENMGLLKNDRFVSEEIKQKACNILHFLATGKPATDESELLLPKILCGIDFSDFVEPANVGDEIVENSAVELLASVIAHWGALKNTSVGALRETFLQRDGQLKIDSAFLLQVSNSGVDILLDRVPWGFRNYKLPWMHKFIITEWH